MNFGRGQIALIIGGPGKNHGFSSQVSGAEPARSTRYFRSCGRKPCTANPYPPRGFPFRIGTVCGGRCALRVLAASPICAIDRKKKSRFKSLKKGETVTFTVMVDSKGQPQAQSVTNDRLLALTASGRLGEVDPTPLGFTPGVNAR